jgi:Gluconolactonase
MCPESDCSNLEHGGLAATEYGFLLAKPHNERLTDFRFDQAAGLAARHIYSPSENGHVYDVAAGDDRRFVVSVLEPTERDSAGAQRYTAALRIGSATESETIVLETHNLPGLGDPIGVAYSTAPDRTRFYVADRLGNQLRWSYLDQRNGKLGPPRTFWEMKAVEDKSTLLHMVTARVDGLGEVVFAGGPDGLYIFQPDEGVLLGKFVLHRPVKGLAWGRRGELFLTAGRYLCVLRTSVKDAPAPGAGDSKKVIESGS